MKDKEQSKKDLFSFISEQLIKGKEELVKGKEDIIKALMKEITKSLSSINYKKELSTFFKNNKIRVIIDFEPKKKKKTRKKQA